jgi:prepilin-type N-terminal cleavage/methylation domain-containing protein
MNRSGFTMIELIFVIVILGILAAVAIPRLAATRDDAKVSARIQEATQFLYEMSSYYTARGAFGTVHEMSNIRLSTNPTSDTDAGNSDMNSTSGKVYLTDGNKIGCVEFTAGDTAGSPKAGSYDGNITVKNLGGANAVCRGVEKMLADRNISSATGITHTFQGIKVTY